MFLLCSSDQSDTDSWLPSCDVVLPRQGQRSGKTWVSWLYFCTDPCVCPSGCRSGASPWPRPATCMKTQAAVTVKWPLVGVGRLFVIMTINKETCTSVISYLLLSIPRLKSHDMRCHQKTTLWVGIKGQPHDLNQSLWKFCREWRCLFWLHGNNSHLIDNLPLLHHHLSAARSSSRAVYISEQTLSVPGWGG